MSTDLDPARADARNCTALQLEAAIWSLSMSLHEADHEPTREYLAYQLAAYRDELAMRERIGDPVAPLRRSSAALDLERIKAAYPLTEVLPRLAAMDLQARGNRFFACCPFPDHHDGTPSFTVSADGRLWRCHGCQRGGDVFSFGMEWFGARSFIAAVDLIVTAMGGRLEAFRDAPARTPRQGVAHVA